MYSRYPNYRFSGGVKIPDNYSGNAFKPSEKPEDELVPAEVSAQEEGTASENENSSALSVAVTETEKEPESVQTEKHGGRGFAFPGFKFNIGKLFSGGIGFEELLIIGLILLISQNGTDDDIILLLALLLFIG